MAWSTCNSELMGCVSLPVGIARCFHLSSWNRVIVVWTPRVSSSGSSLWVDCEWSRGGGLPAPDLSASHGLWLRCLANSQDGGRGPGSHTVKHRDQRGRKNGLGFWSLTEVRGGSQQWKRHLCLPGAQSGPWGPFRMNRAGSPAGA